MLSAKPSDSAPEISAARHARQVAAALVEVVADGERLRVGGDVERLESVAAKHRRRAGAGEVVDVGRDHRPPAGAEQAGDAAARVGQLERDDAAGAQQLGDPLERGVGARQVLEHVAHHDAVVVAERKVGREQLLGSDVEPEPLAGVAGGERRRLDPDRLAPAALRGLGEQEADPAADIEDRAARRRVALDPLEHRGERVPLAGLLLDVRVGLGDLVGGVELRLGGEAVELHVAAGAAAGDVGERRPELLRRRDQALIAHLAADREVRAQVGGAARGAAVCRVDPRAGGLSRHRSRCCGARRRGRADGP